jgi:glycerophosphoryl diester phosphodiesterase
VWFVIHRRRVLALTVLVLLSALPAPAHAGPPEPAATQPVLVVAHRGASAEAPEHTGPAYDRAVQEGADMVECDLQLTADEQLVCIHDATVDRTTGGAVVGPVDSFTLAQLREMDFGSWFGPEFAGARVVTLDEQLACFRAIDPTITYYIETKTLLQPDQADRDDLMERELVDVLRRHDLIPTLPGPVRSSPVLIQSFDLESLETVRRLAPELPTAYLLSVPTDDVVAGRFPDVDVLAPSALVIETSPELVARAHAAGLEVHTWTVDDPAQMTAMIDAGVDAFFTNDPATGRAVVDGAGRGSGRTPAAAPGDQPAEQTAVESCPPGMGVGLQAIGADEPPPAESESESSDGVQLPGWIVIAVVLAGLVLGAVLFERSRAAARSSKS